MVKSFLVVSQSVECKLTTQVKKKLPKICFRKIPMCIIEISKYRTFSSYILIGDSTTEFVPAISKVFETLTVNPCGSYRFHHSYPWLYTWLPCNLPCSLTLQHKWRCYKTYLLSKIIKYPGNVNYTFETLLIYFYGEVYCSKVPNTQWIDWDYIMNRFLRGFFFGIYSKTSFLKKDIIEKRL